MGKLIFVSSGKGGVGKSVFASNLGAVFGGRGYRVCVVDMNIGLRNIDIYLGLQDNIVFDIADVMNGVVPLSRALVRDRRLPRTFLLATTQRKEKFTAGEDQVRALYRELRELFDIVLVDGPAGVGIEMQLAATAADAAVIVATPEYVSIRDADMIDQTLGARGIRRRFYVINKVNRQLLGTGALPSVERIASVMKAPLLGVIQHDDAIHLSANRGIPIVLQKGNYIERNFNKIADRLLEVV
ncbi:MAG: septum site-determining protein MinD [Clostridiales Family XIII bacterium]|jgi:septum site-determining protein MinD|nr:septum site-determining protein MinD [Clostridiales Family XIII bacterium]